MILISGLVLNTSGFYTTPVIQGVIIGQIITSILVFHKMQITANSLLQKIVTGVIPWYFVILYYLNGLL